MKRTMNRLLARLAMLCIAIILGAIAVSQAQRGMQQQAAGTGTAPATSESSQVANAPFSAFQAPIPNEQPAVERPAPQTTAFQPSVPTTLAPAPLAEPDLPPHGAGEFRPTSNQVAAENSSSESGNYYEPTYGSDHDAYEPQSVYPAATNEEPASLPAAMRDSQVVKVGNDESPGESNLLLNANLNAGNDDSFQPGPAAELPPINQLPVDEPHVNDFPAAAPTFDPEPEPTSFAAEPEPNFNNGFDGRARIAIQEPAPQRMEPLAQPRNNFATPSLPVDAMHGIGRPGPSELEGIQTPSLTVAKSAPRGTQVGQPARFEVVIRNVGAIRADDVVIRDEVPQGTSLVQTDPPASRSADGSVLWQIGTIEPGREVRVSMEVMPQEEGEIGSVATISFQTSASARTVSTRPQLEIEHDGLPQVLIGEDVVFNIKITNPGTGIAYNVRLEEDVPEGLRHFDGRELEYKVGDLKPGETRLLELKLKADKPGVVNNLLYARADAGLEVADDFEFEVVAPGLQVEVNGPTRRYLERRAAFEIAVANPGTAAAHDVNLVARLPRGLRFVDTNNAGRYDSATHTVRWSLSELPAKEMGTVELSTMPTTMGEQRIHVETTASMGLQAVAEHEIVVDGLAALLFTVTDVSDPIEVGGQTTYEVHVVNQGTKPATNIRVDASIPPGMEAINGEGPAQATIEGNRIAFQPLARLAPQADTFYKIHVRGTTAGDKRVVVRLSSDDVADPVKKEESTHVYADQ